MLNYAAFQRKDKAAVTLGMIVLLSESDILWKNPGERNPHVPYVMTEERSRVPFILQQIPGGYVGVWYDPAIYLPDEMNAVMERLGYTMISPEGNANVQYC